MSERTRIRLDRELTLRSLTRQTVPVRVLELSGDVHEVRLVLALAPASWAAAQRDGLFNLGPGDRSDQLDAARGVELDAVLRRDVAAVMELDAVARALAAAESASPVMCTEAWRAVSVVQATRLPAGLEGSLKTGFRTAWAEGGPRRSSGPPTAPPAEVIARVAERHELALEDLGDGLYRAHTARWPLLIRLSEQRCAVYSVHPRLVPPERRAGAAAWIAQTNYDLLIGDFEMDGDDGEVRFRTSLDTTGDRLSDALFDRLLVGNLAAFAARFDEIG